MFWPTFHNTVTLWSLIILSVLCLNFHQGIDVVEQVRDYLQLDYACAGVRSVTNILPLKWQPHNFLYWCLSKCKVFPYSRHEAYKGSRGWAVFVTFALCGVAFRHCKHKPSCGRNFWVNADGQMTDGMVWLAAAMCLTLCRLVGLVFSCMHVCMYVVLAQAPQSGVAFCRVLISLAARGVGGGRHWPIHLVVNTSVGVEAPSNRN